MRNRDVATLIAWLTFVPAFTGCGTPTVAVHGVLHKDGKPYEFAKDEQVQITLTCVRADGLPFSASSRVNNDGTFLLGGAHGHGIPPGEYKIAVNAQIYGPGNDGDLLSGEFAEEVTPLKCAVAAAAKQELVVDVGTKTVSVK